MQAIANIAKLQALSLPNLSCFFDVENSKIDAYEDNPSTKRKPWIFKRTQKEVKHRRLNMDLTKEAIDKIEDLVTQSRKVVVRG